jgi:hypothetical protein
MTKRIAAIVLFVLIAAAAVTPIRSYDYFWHLATGRWIVDHHAIPVTDPLAVASVKTPWINGEWLYEVALYATHISDAATSVLNALLIAAIFSAGFWLAARKNDWTIAILAAALAFAGASDRLGVRPSTAAALLIVIAIGALSSNVRRVEIVYAVVTIVWINIHPSALLAPVIALLFGRWLTAGISAVALLVNPYGWHAIRAPIELSSVASSGEYLNAEWLPSDPKLFPLLYASAAIVALALIIARDKRANLWRYAIFAMLLILAIRHVRYQGLYFAALPLLLPPIRMWDRFSTRPRPPSGRPSGGGRVKTPSHIFAAAALVPIGWAFAHDTHRPGVDDERFPVRAAAALKASQLPGNIYNVDQFGGLLEWTFYPAQRVLTDGRNELFRQFIADDARARTDSRAWHAMIAKYNVALAVDEYQADKIEVVDMASGERRALPASLVRYRRRDWALIAFDDAAMVFARRNSFPPERIAALEYRYLVPDDPAIPYASPEIRDAAKQEVARARREMGDIKVVRELEATSP